MSNRRGKREGKGWAAQILWHLNKDLPDDEYAVRLDRGLHVFFIENPGIHLEGKAELRLGKDSVIISMLLVWDDDRELQWVAAVLKKHLNGVGLYPS